MAMDATGAALGAAIQSALAAAFPSNTFTSTEQTAIWKAVSGAIVAYIQQHATITVVSVAGVTTGSGVSGPGTGAIT